MTLALHELVTNAVKHGAFANREGRIELSWKVEPSPSATKLHLAWSEEGGPPVAAAQTQGLRIALAELARGAIGSCLFVRIPQHRLQMSSWRSH